MADFTYTVGPSGRTYTTIQAAWNALPSTINSGDRHFITLAAALYTAGLKCSSSAKTISGTGQVIIMPESGAAWYEQPGALTRYDNTKGATVEASPFAEASFILQDKVIVQGLQMNGGGTKGSIDYAVGTTAASISRCLIQADATDTFCLKISGAITGDIFNNIFITSHTGPPIYIADTNAKTCNFVGNTVIKPGGGGGNWNIGSFGTGLYVKDCAIFGFSGTDTARVNSSSSNNASDLGTFPGTSNVLSLTASAQFLDDTSGTLDVRPKAGNSLVSGITNALIGSDVFGTARANPPTIGAVEYVSAGGTTTITGTVGNAAADGQPAGITTSSGTTITGLIGNAVADGVLSVVTNLLRTAPMVNNTDTGVLANQAVVWTWTPAGRIGSMAGLTPVDGTGTTDSLGRLVPGFTAAVGRLDVAKRNADATVDEVFYQAYK